MYEENSSVPEVQQFSQRCNTISLTTSGTDLYYNEILLFSPQPGFQVDPVPGVEDLPLCLYIDVVVGGPLKKALGMLFTSHKGKLHYAHFDGVKRSAFPRKTTT